MKLLTELGYFVSVLLNFCINNQSTVAISKYMEHHGYMKHLDLCFFWLKDQVEAIIIATAYILTIDNVADILIKAVLPEKMKICYSLIGLEDLLYQEGVLMMGDVFYQESILFWIIFMHFFCFLFEPLWLWMAHKLLGLRVAQDATPMPLFSQRPVFVIGPRYHTCSLLFVLFFILCCFYLILVLQQLISLWSKSSIPLDSYSLDHSPIVIELSLYHSIVPLALLSLCLIFPLSQQGLFPLQRLKAL